MARLIDADELLKDNIHIVGGIRTTSGKIQNIDAIQTSTIENAPTVDAVEVVRCRDCEHWDDEWCDINEAYFEDDDFCSYGEWKEKQG